MNSLEVRSTEKSTNTEPCVGKYRIKFSVSVAHLLQNHKEVYFCFKDTARNRLMTRNNLC